VLRELGDSASRQAVHQAVQTLFDSQFTADDVRPRRGRGGAEAAWRNNLDFLYDRLKKEGVFLPSHRGDPWSLSPTGWVEASALPSVGIGVLGPNGQFRPKSSSPYTANIAAAVQVKMREHEGLLADYGKAIGAAGWEANTEVHPRDMELSRGTETWLVEVKMIYGARVTAAVREALAQLLSYRYVHYRNAPQPDLLAVFSKEPDAENIGLLQSIGIASIWRDGSKWGGCANVAAAGLVPMSMAVPATNMPL
jgi:hypothetical protein